MNSTKNIGVAYNPWAPRSEELVSKLRHKLDLVESSWVVAASTTDFPDLPEDISLIITVGGDGTILWANRIASPKEIPILGINLGRVGFLTELSADGAIANLDDYISGKARVEDRSMLHAVVTSNNETKAFTQELHALNDVVVGRSAISRLVHLEVKIDGAVLTTYRSDAVIVATATGSTGYSISAGGPILNPLSRNILINPLATHLGMGSPLVLPSESRIEITLRSDYDAVFSLDGRADLAILPGETVEITESKYKARFLRLNPPNQFYSVLTDRLNPESNQGQNSS